MSGVAGPLARARSLLPLGTTTATVGVASALGVPFLSLFLTAEVHAGPFALGAFLLAGPIASVLVTSLLGRLSDARAIRTKLMMGAAAAGAVGYGLYVVVREYWVLLAVAVTLVAASTSLMSQVFAYAGLELERSKTARAPLVISMLRMLVSMSWVAGPPLAALLVAVSGFTGLFGVVAGCYVLVTLVVSRLPEPRVEQHKPATGHTPPRRRVVLAVAAFVLIQGAGSLGIMNLPLFIAGDMGGSAADAGLVLGLCAALEIPLMVAFGAMAVRFSQHTLVLVGMTVAIAYHGVMAMTTTIGQVAAAQVLNAVVIAAVMGVGISYFQSLDPGRPGAVTALFGNTTVAGTMIAGPLVGIAAKIGYRDAYLMTITMSALGLLALAAAGSGQRRAHHGQRAVVGVQHGVDPERDGELARAVPEPQLPHHGQAEPAE